MAIANVETALNPAGKATAGDARVRLLHLNAGKLYGGVETILVTLARLKSLCPAMESEFGVCFEGRLSEQLRLSGAPVHMLGNVRISRPWTVWRARGELKKILRSERFDLVVCHMPWTLAVFGPVIQASGQKAGFWAHAFHSGTGWLERLARRTTPDLAIANSHFTEAGLRNLFPQAPRVVIYPPVDLTESSDERRPRSILRSQLGASDETVVIAHVSRIEAGKGHQAHLEALARLKTIASPWACWMVGGAQRPEEQALLDQLKGLSETLGIADRVRFLGQRSDVNDLLQAADIFCQPNLTPDSFGISFVEALWAGRPVVTSAIGGALEIVDDSCGLLTPPGDVDGLARALGRLIEQGELRGALGRRGRARALELCDPAARMSALSSAAARYGRGAP